MTINKIIDLPKKPDAKIDVAKVFNIDSDLVVRGYKDKTDWVPQVDESYVFDKDTTLSILAGFEHNRRVMVQGFHGTGKSTHIEQIAARLNWPCVRINLDSHISRIDLLGKDAITLNNGKQILNFKKDYFPGLYKIQLHWYLMNTMQEGLMLCLSFKGSLKLKAS